jgi:hypothetical protein
VVIVCCLAAPALAGLDDDEDLYDEGVPMPYKEGPKWQEQDTELPPYPASDRLIQADVALTGFPFTVWIDPDSLSVGDDRVLRYTVVLRSNSGAENVIYEGLRCRHDQYKRYAYGSDGRFHRVADAKWRYLGSAGTDRYRHALAKDFFCPLPGRDPVGRLLHRLKRGNPQRHFFSD